MVDVRGPPWQGRRGQGPRSPSALGHGHAAATWGTADRVTITEWECVTPRLVVTHRRLGLFHAAHILLKRK